MTTWYDPDEIIYQADNAKTQPEFAPLHGEGDPLNDDEAIRIVDDVPDEDDTLSDNVDDFATGIDRIRAIIDNDITQ